MVAPRDTLEFRERVADAGKRGAIGSGSVGERSKKEAGLLG